MLPSIGDLRPWADPGVIALGRLGMFPPVTATTGTIAGDSRRDQNAAAARWRRSLDGRWDFRLFDAPERVPATAVTRPVGERGWTKVAVPGNWTMQGVGDLPHYTNVRMPFDGPPPRLPEPNPTGVYRRTVRIPGSWLERQVVFHVGGAESAHALYVNGRFAGYGTDSRLASEYDVTDLVHAGPNEVAIVVVRWSAHSYLEDQDQWWMAGLHRQVFVEARAPIHLAAVACDTGLRGSTGTLELRATIGGLHPPRRGWQVRAAVETLRGRRLGRSSTAPVPSSFDSPYVFSGHTSRLSFEFDDIEPWSAESPTRYRVAVELIDPDGEVVEVREQLVGFRSVEVRDRRLLVNGRPIWIFGVNRHDHHPVRGKAVTVEDMREDLLAMRRHNITAVRCAHYPNDPRFLDLCDEIGMYVVDEANIESHAYNTSLCDDPRYRSAWLARGARMVERDRNHPSVILWSLGNESGYGANHDALAGWIRRADPSRPLHYEGAVFHDGWIDGGLPATDVVCPMYPPIAAIEQYGRRGLGDRPLIMCEYSHAMGNSNGSLADYWDVIDRTPGLQGGFIWEWKDHGLLATLPNRKRGFAYGGQFGDDPNDGNFVADGLMSSDLRAHPAMQEVAWVYRPVTVERSDDAASLTVTNRRTFTDLEDLRADWELLVDGVVAGAGELDVGLVAAGSAVTVEVPCGSPGGDAHLTVRWSQRRATPWAPAGHLVAWDQLPLTPSMAPSVPSATPVPPEIARNPVARRNTDAIFRMDGGGGRRVGGTSARRAAAGGAPWGDVELCLFRAPVDNDGLKLLPDLGRRVGAGAETLARWREIGVDRLPADELVAHEHRVERDADGAEVHHHEVRVPDDLADLPRIGIRFELPAAFDRMRWYGRGPLENYPDRNRGALLGIWAAGIDEPPYLVPQDFGLRTDCRWFELVGDDGTTVRLEPLDPPVLHCAATHFRVEDLAGAAHETELRPRRRLIVHADVAHRGLGTASCGPDVLDRYRIAPGTYRFTYRLSTAVRTDAGASARSPGR